MSNGIPVPTLDPRTTTEVDPSVVAEYVDPLAARAAFWTHQTGIPGGQSGSTPPPAPAPQITALAPSSSPAGGSGVDVVITGANFVQGATASFYGQPIAIGFNSSTSLNVWIAGTLMQNPGSGPIQVQNPDGQLSNLFTFTVT